MNGCSYMTTRCHELLHFLSSRGTRRFPHPWRWARMAAVDPSGGFTGPVVESTLVDFHRVEFLIHFHN